MIEDYQMLKRRGLVRLESKGRAFVAIHKRFDQVTGDEDCEEEVSVDRESLEGERASLLQRLADVNAILKDVSAFSVK